MNIQRKNLLTHKMVRPSSVDRFLPIFERGTFKCERSAFGYVELKPRVCLFLQRAKINWRQAKSFITVRNREFLGIEPKMINSLHELCINHFFINFNSPFECSLMNDWDCWMLNAIHFKSMARAFRFHFAYHKTFHRWWELEHRHTKLRCLS